MSYPSFDLRCCRRPYKILAIGIAVWGLISGFLYFMDTMVLAIHILKEESTMLLDELRNIYYAIHIVLFEYAIVMIIIFSTFLLYGSIMEGADKSCFVFSWMVYAAVSGASALLNLMTILHHHFTSYMIIEEVLVLCIQFGCILIIYNYYKTMPRTMTV